jgi:hypothetical protein
MLNVGCESGLWNGELHTGVWVRGCRRENRRIANGEMKQETEQEDCELRDESGDRKQNGEDLKQCSVFFVVFTYESGIFA